MVSAISVVSCLAGSQGFLRTAGSLCGRRTLAEESASARVGVSAARQHSAQIQCTYCSCGHGDAVLRKEPPVGIDPTTVRLRSARSAN